MGYLILLYDCYYMTNYYVTSLKYNVRSDHYLVTVRLFGMRNGTVLPGMLGISRFEPAETQARF